MRDIDFRTLAGLFSKGFEGKVSCEAELSMFTGEDVTSRIVGYSGEMVIENQDKRYVIVGEGERLNLRLNKHSGAPGFSTEQSIIYVPIDFEKRKGMIWISHPTSIRY
ncbi:MAG: hypothetical protein AABX11_01240 [Nanoarchaeota archaeon]